MESLPMAPDTCSLSAADLAVQLQRYRAVGQGAAVTRRDAMRLELVVGDDVADATIETLVATEQACCPFLGLDWTPANRRLTIAVAVARDRPALELIAQALGLPSH